MGPEYVSQVVFVNAAGEKAIQISEDEKQQAEEWASRPWQERLNEWKRIFAEEKIEELTDETTRYTVKASMPEVRANYLAEQAAIQSQASSYTPSFWVARRWWKYRPKLPYTYFLSQVENLQVSYKSVNDLHRNSLLHTKVVVPSHPYSF